MRSIRIGTSRNAFWLPRGVRVENPKESSKSSSSLQRNAELQSVQQNYGDDPLADRATDLYRREFVMGFADKWDELIDWDARAKSEGQFFIDILRAHGRRAFSMSPRAPAFIPSV